MSRNLRDKGWIIGSSSSSEDGDLRSFEDARSCQENLSQASKEQGAQTSVQKPQLVTGQEGDDLDNLDVFY